MVILNQAKGYLKNLHFARSTYELVLSSNYSFQKIWNKADYKNILRKEFIDDVRAAIVADRGYATGKIGDSQQHWMYYEVLLSSTQDTDKIKKFEEKLLFHGLKQVGIFPANPSYYLEYNKFYMDHVRNLDCLGLFNYPREIKLIQYYQLKNKFIYFVDQEPDKSSPSNDDSCYLQYFQGKKLLLVCPFGHFLKQRATQEIFENVWLKTGKRWFYPAQVDSVEFPYGFSRDTQEKYPTAIDLYYEIVSEIDKKDFDIALISAAGLAIPIASHIKNRGKVAIDLGGHQQFLFGVTGKRWRDKADFKQKYLNEHWVDMPDYYKPKEKDVCDQGAYW